MIERTKLLNLRVSDEELAKPTRRGRERRDDEPVRAAVDPRLPRADVPRADGASNAHERLAMSNKAKANSKLVEILFQTLESIDEYESGGGEAFLDAEGISFTRCVIRALQARGSSGEPNQPTDDGVRERPQRSPTQT